MLLKRQEKDSLITAIYESSNVLGSIYNPQTNDLDLIFKSGIKYRYSNVSKSDYLRFEIADSQGEVFNTHIKKYPFQKLEKVDTTKILVEVDDLKLKEDKIIYHTKKSKILEKMKYACSLDDDINSDNITNETFTLFSKTLAEIQNLINDFLTYKQ